MSDAPDRCVREKIADGDYDTKIAYPPPPDRPAVLSKRAADLTRDEARTLPQVLAQWEADREAGLRDRRLYNEDEGRLAARFQADLFAEHGLPPDGAFGLEMYRLAWDRGHAGGLGEVATCFEDLLPLWELYRASGPSARS